MPAPIYPQLTSLTGLVPVVASETGNRFSAARYAHHRQTGQQCCCMNQLDRRYQLGRLSRSSLSLGRNALLYELEISRATLKRYLELLRGDIHPTPVSALIRVISARDMHRMERAIYDQAN